METKTPITYYIRCAFIFFMIRVTQLPFFYLDFQEPKNG
jgi:hypothetical protein